MIDRCKFFTGPPIITILNHEKPESIFNRYNEKKEKKSHITEMRFLNVFMPPPPQTALGSSLREIYGILQAIIINFVKKSNKEKKRMICIKSSLKKFVDERNLKA